MEHILLYSDGHGKLPNIPKKYRNGETLIVFAGDQCNNYVQNFQPFIKVGEILIPCEWKEDWNFRKINKEEEAKLQGEWIEKEFLPKLSKIPYWSEMSDGKRAALLSFSYNLGADFYGSADFSTISTRLKNKEWDKVPDALYLYRNPGSNVEAGLARRRKAEGESWKLG